MTAISTSLHGFGQSEPDVSVLRVIEALGGVINLNGLPSSANEVSTHGSFFLVARTQENLT
jgi:hypothetical protein